MHVTFDYGFEYFNLLHNISIAIVNHLTTDIKNYPITSDSAKIEAVSNTLHYTPYKYHFRHMATLR